MDGATGPARRLAVSFCALRANHPNRRLPMGKLFFHMGVFALVTFVIFLVCMQFVRIEERREAKRRQRNS